MTAQALHNRGFTVLAACLTDKSKGFRSLSQMNIKTLEFDVTKEEQIISAKTNVQNYLKETNSQLWALVNNSGLFGFGYNEWGDMNDLKKILEVNVIGMVRVSRHFLPLIRKSKGRVVNMGSCAGRFTLPNLSFYSMSKHAVIAFSDGLRREMFGWDVKVITIEPQAYQSVLCSSKQLFKYISIDYLLEQNSDVRRRDGYLFASGCLEWVDTRG